jgi:hypothetical protein
LEDNIKMALREMVFGDVDWIHLVQDRDRRLALGFHERRRVS